MSNAASALVAQRIKDELIRQDRTPAWLAKRSGIAPTTLDRKLNARPDTLTVSELALIALALGVDVAAFFAPSAPALDVAA